MTDAPAFDAEIAEQIDMILDMVNTGFADTLAFVSRWNEADDTIEAAQLLAIDPRGANAEVSTPEGTRPARIDFAEPITGLEGLESAFMGLIAEARSARPTEPLTSIEQRLEQSELQRTHRCAVVAIEDLSPRLRALTLGPIPDWEDLGGDQSMTIFLDLPGRPVPETIRLSELREMAEDVRPKGATYSIRRHDPSARTIEVWIVLHGDDPHTVAGWAGGAAVGDPITVWGPRRAREPFADVGRFVGVCDEAGLAATLATAEELSAQVPVELIVEVTGESEEFPLSDRPGLTVHWRHRGDVEPGTGTLLTDATRELLTADTDDVAVFGAAESRCITAVRRYVRHELEIPAARVLLTGYWRRT